MYMCGHLFAWHYYMYNITHVHTHTHTGCIILNVAIPKLHPCAPIIDYIQHTTNSQKTLDKQHVQSIQLLQKN